VASSAARHDEDNVHTAAAVLKYDPFKNNAKLVKLATGDGDPLRSGVCDDAVDALQKALDFCHSLSLPDGEAGTFGPATEDGLKQFQERMKTEIGQLAESFGKSAGDVKPGELDRFTLLLLDACAVGHHEADAGNTDGDGAGAAAAPSETERPPAAADTGPQPQWVFDARPGKRKTSIQFGLRLYEALLEWELQYENGIVKPDAEGRGCLYSANHDKSYKPYEDVYNKFFEALPLEQRWKPGTQSPMYAEWPRIDLSHPEIEEGGSGIPKFVDLNGKKYKLYDAAANWVANGRTNCCNSQFAAFFVAAGGKKIQVKKTDGPPVSYSLRNKGNADPYIGKNDKDKDIRPIMAFQAAVMCNGANKDNDGNLIHDHFLRGGGTSAMLCLGLGEPVAENGKYTINQDSLVQVRLGDWANWFSHSWLVADVEYGIWTKDDAKQPDIKVAQSSFVKGSGGAAVPLDKTMLRDLAKDEAGFETRLGAFLKGCREDKKYKGKDVKRFEVVRFCVLSANGTNNVVHGDFYVPKCSKCGSFPDDRGKCKCKCPTCAEPADDKGKCKCDKKKGKPGVLADDSPLVKHEEKTAHPANQKLRGISRNWVNVPSGKPIEEERTEKDEKGKKKQVKTGRTAGPGGSFCRWFGPFSE
ncbi:MAG: peptidoglycan-binding domain-containing protein, partial [Myxococcales bacterium]